MRGTIVRSLGIPHMRFDPSSFRIAIILLAIECIIAAFLHDGFIRPYIGDVLVVMLLFFAIRAFWKAPPLPLALGVLCFAVLVEITQALHLIDRLGWTHSTLSKLVLGNTFQWGDLVCYLVGSIVSLCITGIAEGEQPAR